jgi:hypothetical protein
MSSSKKCRVEESKVSMDCRHDDNSKQSCLAYEMCPLRVLTRAVTYSLAFGIGYGLGLGIFFGFVAGIATGVHSGD